MPEVLTSPSPDDDLVLRLATAAYLGRFTGTSRMHTESDLRLFFAWCTEQHLAPLAAQRAQIERYARWMQELRRFTPSTVSTDGGGHRVPHRVALYDLLVVRW